MTNPKSKQNENKLFSVDYNIVLKLDENRFKQRFDVLFLCESWLRGENRTAYFLCNVIWIESCLVGMHTTSYLNCFIN